ncbi:MAG: DivIVA domain-containing protein [Candidatus Methylomirabilales bacterium]
MTDLTPIEITQRQFKRRFRGLDPIEVKTFLDAVAEEVQRLLKENALQEERIYQLQTRLRGYEQREDELKEAFLSLQRMTDEMKEKVRQEADLILKEAEVKAEKLLDRSHVTLGQLQGKIADLKRQRALFEGRIRAAIKLHQDLLAAEAAEDASEPFDPKGPRAGG